jgi:chemotaxis-related protein WspB
VLLLLFDVQGDRYALDCRDVVEVLPLVAIRTIPLAPRGVAGVMNYHGRAVPVLDLSVLLHDRPSRPALSTRVIVVRYATSSDAGVHLGVIAEQTTEVARRSEADFAPAAIRTPRAGFLGAIATDTRGMVQRVDVSALIPDAVRQALVMPTTTE